MKALVAEGPHKAAFRDVELRPIKDNELLIKVKRAGICATDNAIYTGDCMFVRDGSIVYPCRFGHDGRASWKRSERTSQISKPETALYATTAFPAANVTPARKEDTTTAST